MTAAATPPGDTTPGLEPEAVLDEHGQFNVSDAEIDLTPYRFEDWLTMGLFWVLGLTVFYQFFTRYLLNDSAAWTEEIARYMLISVVFLGAVGAVRKNNHIQVDFFYHILPARLVRAMSTLVDLLRISFFGYACWMTWNLITRIGRQPMSVIDLPMGIVYAAVLFAFVLMTARAIQVAIKHWRQGYSVLERPEMTEV